MKISSPGCSALKASSAAMSLGVIVGLPRYFPSRPAVSRKEERTREDCTPSCTPSCNLLDDSPTAHNGAAVLALAVDRGLRLAQGPTPATERAEHWNVEYRGH